MLLLLEISENQKSFFESLFNEDTQVFTVLNIPIETVNNYYQAAQVKREVQVSFYKRISQIC